VTIEMARKGGPMTFKGIPFLSFMKIFKHQLIP